LKAKDIIGATNGPAEYYYEYIAERFTPLSLPGFTDRIGLQNMSSKEVLRAHVAAIYLSNEQLVYYFSKAYPDQYEDAIKEMDVTQ